jgi:GT2 family glycosyltransferase
VSAEKPVALPAAERPDVSIVVLLTDGVELVRECLSAIAAADDPALACEVVAVLNAAGPEVERLLERELTGARVVRSEVNTGTAPGWNLGFEAARAPWVALVHEDSAPRPGWLSSLLRAVAEHPRAGAVGSRLLLPEGVVENGGWVVWRDGYVTQLDDRTAPAALAARAPYPVDQCSSACLMVERAAWEQVGGFDERYFPAVYADTDLCTALWTLGRPVLSDPRSVVVHRKNAMVRADGGALRSFEFQRFLVERHRRRYVEKWGDALGAYAERDESVAPWDAPPAAVAAALERCAGRAAAPAPPAAPALPPPDRSLTGGDPAGLARRLLAAQVEVQDAFCDALAERLAATPGEAELADLRRRAETHDRIVGGRTWRTRTAVRRALRRPGSR